MGLHGRRQALSGQLLCGLNPSPPPCGATPSSPSPAGICGGPGWGRGLTWALLLAASLQGADGAGVQDAGHAHGQDGAGLPARHCALQPRYVPPPARDVVCTGAPLPPPLVGLPALSPACRSRRGMAVPPPSCGLCEGLTRRPLHTAGSVRHPRPGGVARPLAGPPGSCRPKRGTALHQNLDTPSRRC